MGEKMRQLLIAMAVGVGVAAAEILVAVLQDREVWVEAVVLSFVLVSVVVLLIMRVVSQTRR